MQMIVFVMLAMIFTSVLSLESLQIQTSYGKIKFHSKPEPNFISGEFSPKDEDSIKVIFYSLISDEKREVTLTDENRDVILNYVITPQGIALIQIGQVNFIGHRTTDTILHLPDTHSPTNSDYQTLFSKIEKLEKSNITVQHAMSLTFSMRAYDLMENMSGSIAEVIGPSGRDYPSVMAIHLTARTLIQTKFSFTSPDNAYLVRNTRTNVCTPHDDKGNAEDISECDKLAQGKDCQGMCGPTNTCWKGICGDCCFHQGCDDHDTCCTIHGMSSIKCIAPLSFTCDHYDC